VNIFGMLLSDGPCWRRPRRPFTGSFAIGEGSVGCLSFRIHIDLSVKFASDHVAGIPGEDSELGRFRRVPREYAVAGGVSILVPVTRPGRGVAGERIVIPDERFAVFGALIGAVSTVGGGRDQQQCSVNKKASSVHGSFLSEIRGNRTKIVMHLEDAATM